MAYIKPSVLVYQELENAGGVTNATPDLGVVIVGPLFNVVKVDTASESSLTFTRGASSSDITADAEPTVVDGPNGLKIMLKGTKPGQKVEQSSIIVNATNAYVKTISFQADLSAASTDFDGATFRSKFILWDQTTETYNATFAPAGAYPHLALPDASGSHVKLGDKVVIKYTNPDAVGGTTTYTVASGVVTVNGTSAHGLKVGEKVVLAFSTGDLSAADGEYTIVTAGLNNFTVATTNTTATVGGNLAVNKAMTITTVVTRIEEGLDSTGTMVSKSITVAQPIQSFTTPGAVTADITIQRFYDQMVVPMTFTDGIDTYNNFDLDSADNDYIWLLTDAGPAAYSEVEYGTPDEYEIVGASFHVAYRALRQDKYSTIITISDEAQRLADLGEASELNPLSLGVSIASANSNKPVMAVSLKVDENGAYEWTRAMELLENQRNAYAIVPLTQEPSVIAAFKTHAEQMSTPENASWRVVIANTQIPEVKYILQANPDAPVTTGNAATVGSTLYLKDLVHLNASTELTGEFIGAGVTPGDVVVVTAVTGAVITTLTANTLTGLDPANKQFYKNGATVDISVGTTPNAVTLKPGEYAKATGASAAVKASPEDLVGSWVVDEVTNSDYLKLIGFEDFYATHDELGITYYVYRQLTRTERAQAVAAASSTYKSNRLWHIQPDVVGVNVGGVTKYLPGYYLCAGHGGMTSGFAPQQGFTNISVAGITDLQNSNFYFKKEELNLMAEAGTCLYVQETQGTTPYCRHSITTDMTVLEYREQVKVKKWDFLSFYFYDKMKGFIGSWNITPDTLSNMKQSMIASCELLITQKLPRIGAPLLSYEEPSVTQNATNKDMVDIRVKIETVTPNNYTNIYLVI